jgi:threonine/homoserine/homoserine lactone efflux protein
MKYASLMLFVISTCGSPGPNNLMVMSSGASYGFRRSLPHVVGINVGFPLMVVAVGLGMEEVLHTSPFVYDLLRPMAVAYLLYLAYRIGTTRVDAGDVQHGKPFSALQAALFQWVNPKAWVMIVGAVVTYATASASYVPQILAIALVFLVLGTPCTTAWLWMGTSLRNIFRRPTQLRAFNVSMALLLAASVAPIVGEIYRRHIG